MGTTVTNALSKALEDIRKSDDLLRASGQLQNSGTLNELQKAYEKAQTLGAFSDLQRTYQQTLNSAAFGGVQRAVASDQNVTHVAETPARVKKQNPTRVVGYDAGPHAITDMAAIGRVARNARKSLRLTQGKLSILAGVGRRFVSELENGKATLEVGRVLKVLSALGIDLLARQR